MAPPLKYKKEYAEQIRSIVDRLIAKDEYPSVAGIAVEIGVPKATLCLWASDNKTYGHVDIRREVGRARDYREQWLERHGSDGSSPPQIVRFLLSSHAGYVEKTAQDVTVGQDQDKPFRVEVKVDI